MKVKMTKPAQRRLNKIDDYYKAKGNTSKGQKLRKNIVEKSALLSKNPHLGSEEKYLKHLGKGHRSLVISRFFKMIYRVAKRIIYITDIFDTRQSTKKMKP